VSSAIAIEMEFVVDPLPVELIGMNSAMMCNNIKFFTDRLLLSLGCSGHFKVGNPFKWMEMMSLQGKTNRESVLTAWINTSPSTTVFELNGMTKHIKSKM